MNLELFPCSGGMAEGFRRAGIAFDLAIDHSTDACDSYERNLGHRPVQMDVHDFARMVRLGWRPGEIDLLVADPPCTPWSRAGKRLGLDDERDCLAVTAELIALLRPRRYLIGNVPGLQDSSSWDVVQRVIGGLSQYGYCVRDYVSLDAANYGVPQRRIRPFWVGHLDGPCIQWPSPTHGNPTRIEEALPGMPQLRPWVTCRDALGHLSIEELGGPVRLRWKATTDHRAASTDEPAKTLTRNTNGDGSIIALPNHRPNAPDEPSQAVVAKLSRVGSQILAVDESRLVGAWTNGNHLPSRIDEPALTITAAGRSSASSVLAFDEPAKKRPPSTKGHQSERAGDAAMPAPTIDARPARNGSGNATLDWPWDRLATTVTADERIPPPGHHDQPNPRTLPNAIVLSERAAAILQGFPESWHFAGKTKRSRWSQLGMAMPPPLAEAVARSVAAQMSKKDLDGAASDMP